MLLLESFGIEPIRIDQDREEHPHEDFKPAFVGFIHIIEFQPRRAVG